MIAVIGLGGVAMMGVVVLLLGAGDRQPVAPNCLPNVPRTHQRVATGGVVMPLTPGSYTVSSPFGMREGGMHRGVDFAAELGTPIFAATSGRVVAAGRADGFGHWIVIDTAYGGAPLSTVYGHMRSGGIFVKEGDEVSAGQPIGAVGDDGESSGPHLHFEVVPGGRLTGGQQIDPAPWLDEGTKYAAAPAMRSVADDEVATLKRTSRSRWVAGPDIRSRVCAPEHSAGVGNSLQAGSVPEEYDMWIRKAAGTCPEVTAPLLAAELKQESGFQKFARSPAGALGPAQFMPDTWARHGVDGDGDGQTDIYSVADAVMSQAAYACSLVEIAKAGLAEGTLRGDLTELWLSMYNCGPEGTLRQGGVCQNAETQSYVKAIPRMAAQYAAVGRAPGGKGLTAAAPS
ncbi:peptidoglycan DD-metalloendopeptidase family protein [Nocardia sp. NPDC049149]|uniref:peptidoglycan DD-metalloendopeptidase family protein n=1 Tax=Nocardia sp. NPDC049149 TaxID=3364315 RepID=UPI00371F54BD